MYNDLERKSVREPTRIDHRIQKIALAIESAKPQLDLMLEAVVEKVKAGGRMIYLGAGTGASLGARCAGAAHHLRHEDDTICAVLAGGIDKLILGLEEKDDAEESWEMLTEKG